MAFDFGAGPKHNPYINYFLAGFMIVCFLLSTSLNPLIFYSYTKKSKTIQNFLFKLIAVTDFLTNLVPTLFMSYVFLSKMNFEYTFSNQLPEFFSCTFGCISQVTTTMMAVTRMISIIKPFFIVKFKWVLAYLIFYAIYMSIGNAGSLMITGIKNAQNISEEEYQVMLEHHGNHLDFSVATIETLNKFVCFVMNVFHCFLGIFCSFVTVGYLRILVGGSAEQARKLKSCNTILIMNVPYVISIVSNFLAFYQVFGIDFKLVNHYLLPILTSAFNPCVIVARTDAIKVALSSPTSRRPSMYSRSAMITTAETRRYSQKAPMVIYENPSMVQENGTDTENSGVYLPENENNLELVSVSNTSSPTRSRLTAKSCESTSTDRICDVDSVLVDDRSD
jgi:hypothetical protein